MMKRIWMVAVRDFVTTVSGKGFLIGLLIMPLLIFMVISLAPRILSSRTPQVQGEVAVIDRTGTALPELRIALDPTNIATRRAEQAQRGMSASGAGSRPPPGLLPVPSLTLLARMPDTDVQQEKAWLLQGPKETPRHLAVIVIHADAVRRGSSNAEYGAYDLYVAKGLNEATCPFWPDCCCSWG
jgi:hypothetical protein